MLASSFETLPLDDGWIYEPKWDGFRALAHVRGGEAALESRAGHDLTARFPRLARALSKAVQRRDAVLDGEICALDEHGRPRFELLQRGEGALVYVAFDLLEEAGRPLVDLPLRDRRARLEALVDPAAGPVLVSPQFEDGAALLEAAREQGLEGVVAKRLGSRYHPGRRSPEWRKVKVRREQEVVIVGYTRGRGRRGHGIGALVTAVRDAGKLRWVGNVGTGFDDAELDRLLALLRPLARDRSPLDPPPRMPRVRRSDIVWVEPRLVAQVAFTEWTPAGRMRAPVYLGVREDKVPEEVRRERERLPSTLRRGRRELRLSNLEKPFWPEEGLAKRDLLGYYRELAPVVVAHLRDRPFTMVRYPDGWRGKHFFQKRAPAHMPPWIRRASLPVSLRADDERTIEYPLVNDELALLWMVNMGCIELHTWASRVDRPERPDWVVLDLDPSSEATFAEVVEVALLVREALELLELASYPKTSGSRGMHVLVPIARRHTFEDARELATIIGRALARAHPDLVTTEWSRKERRGVLIDVHQNGLGRTTAAVYSVRPRPGAPVSTPLRWEEVRPGLDPAAFSMDVVLDRVAREGDLFAGVLAGGQSLAKALRALR
jgi:bifunctional non-homologous end joining protein LigD